MNLLQEEFMPRLEGALLRQAGITGAVMFGVVILLSLLRLGYQVHVRGAAVSMMEAEIRSVYSDAFPGKEAVARTSTQQELLGMFERSVEEARRSSGAARSGSSSVLDILHELAASVSGSPGTRITQITIEGTLLRVSGVSSLAGFSELEQNLVQSPLFEGVSVDRANAEAGKVKFDMSVTFRGRVPGGGGPS